ncbi:MAG: hypothetical protein KJ000_11235 [Pirellulaceae bacterium]|nr:hypothetical protein [Pirellulaceae bacterium]
MGWRVNIKRFRRWHEWSTLLLLFGIALAYQALVTHLLDVFLREALDDLIFPGHSIYLNTTLGSMLVAPLVLTMWALLGFERLATQLLWTFLLCLLAWAILFGLDSHSKIGTVALFVPFMVPWLCLRCCLRWRCTASSGPSGSEMRRGRPRQFSLADVLSAITAIGFLLAISRSEVSDIWWSLEQLRVVLLEMIKAAWFLAPGYCLAWAVLADGWARRLGFAACILTGIVLSGGFLLLVCRNAEDCSAVLFYFLAPFYASVMAGLTLAFFSLRLIGVRLVRLPPPSD